MIQGEQANKHTSRPEHECTRRPHFHKLSMSKLGTSAQVNKCMGYILCHRHEITYEIVSGTIILRDCERVNESIIGYDVTGSCDWNGTISVQNWPI